MKKISYLNTVLDERPSFFRDDIYAMLIFLILIPFVGLKHQILLKPVGQSP